MIVKPQLAVIQNIFSLVPYIIEFQYYWHNYIKNSCYSTYDIYLNIYLNIFPGLS